MSYEVRCECGKAHAVSAADAGSSLRCDCGRTVEVPPLHELKLAAGQSAVSPELLLQSLLVNRELPDTDECGSCGKHTDGSLNAIIDCERAEVKVEERTPTGCLPLPFGAIIYYRTTRAQVRGRDVVFRVPVRCCPACARTLTGDGLRLLLRQNRVCAGVLDKYPHARVTRA
jgi:hypothetical protein